MALPPERISVKRRREDDPVETLYLEHTGAHGSKRRFTNFVFQRIQSDQTTTVSRPPHNNSMQRDQRSYSSGRSHDGIPIVHATAPGDEIRDLLALKAAHKRRLDLLREYPTKPAEMPKSAATDSSLAYRPRKPQVPPHVRRFHLSRENGPLSPALSGGIRKLNPEKKSRIATFMEKRANPLGTNSIALLTPKDPRPESNISVASIGDVGRSGEKTTPRAKIGTSMHDPSSTWDLESDQLADELAAFAVELDSANRRSSTGKEGIATNTLGTVTEDIDHALNDGFVYETYVRVPQESLPLTQRDTEKSTTAIGVLVIADDDEELWRTYAESDEESERDEEDADSNAEDNPANDYPDEEVSSDDEFEYNAYKYRINHSDDEEYDVGEAEFNY